MYTQLQGIGALGRALPVETREGSKSSQKFANLSLPLAGNCYGNVISAREKAICRLHLRGPLVLESRGEAGRSFL